MIPIEVAPSKQPQRSSFEAARIDGFIAQAQWFIEVVPSNQLQRSSFEAATINGFRAQGNDSHRNRSFEVIEIN